jgi:hypothetical protein
MTKEELTARVFQERNELDAECQHLRNELIEVRRERDALIQQREEYFALFRRVESERDALKARSQVVTPNYGCTCHSSAGCSVHAWTHQPWTMPYLKQPL